VLATLRASSAALPQARDGQAGSGNTRRRQPRGRRRPVLPGGAVRRPGRRRRSRCGCSGSCCRCGSRRPLTAAVRRSWWAAS
jgi:hypothetical protein